LIVNQILVDCERSSSYGWLTNLNNTTAMHLGNARRSPGRECYQKNPRCKHRGNVHRFSDWDTLF